MGCSGDVPGTQTLDSEVDPGGGSTGATDSGKGSSTDGGVGVDLVEVVGQGGLDGSAGQNPGGQNPGGQNPGGQNPGGQNPGGQNPGGVLPNGCIQELPPTIDADLTILAGCDVLVPKSSYVANNATLYVRGGARLRFADGASLNIGEANAGRLEANDDANVAPITFTSASATPSGGSWGGIRFRRYAMAGSVIRRARIEYAGSTSSAAVDLHLYSQADRITLQDIVFANNSAGAIKNISTAGTFAEFRDNEIVAGTNGPWSIRLHANIARSLGPNNTIGAPIEIDGGTMSTSGTWRNHQQPYVVKKTVYVDEGAILTLEKGTTLQFSSGQGLVVGNSGSGGLVAVGTALDVITFTSAAAMPAAGDWRGIDFGRYVMAGTTLDWVELRHAGSGNFAAIDVHLYLKPDRISITRTLIETNSSGAIKVPGDDATFKDFQHNVLRDNGPWSMELRANVVGSLGESNTFGAPIRIDGGTVKKTATWRRFFSNNPADPQLPGADVPYLLTRDVYVGAPGGAVLTIESYTDILFEQPNYLFVGMNMGESGALRAQHVTFASGTASASPGDWKGVEFGRYVMASNLESCWFRHGGSGAGALAGIVTIHADSVPKVSLVGSHFADNGGVNNLYLKGPADGMCGKYLAAVPENTWDLNPCAD
jgi:hypothetical protein